MKVTLVGTNVELEPLTPLVTDKTLLSPEPIAAAYARISRSPESVQELRTSARTDVESARRSNQRIVFDMGHSSIAEHAVFNFDIEGLSRLAIEELERCRLASYTERSQRYVLLETAYHTPSEFEGHPQRLGAFRARCDALFASYNALHQRLYERQVERLETPPAKAQRQQLETASREDARYVLPLATLGQLGMTVNARTLEAAARRMKGHDLVEVRQLGAALEAAALEVAPSLIRYTQPRGLEDPSAQWPTVDCRHLDASLGREQADVRLVRYTPNPDEVLAEALDWMRSGSASVAELRRWLDAYYQSAKAHDGAPRLLEFVEFTFDAVVSAACFGQLKRHRMATLIAGPYDPALGVRLPPSIQEAGLAFELMDAAKLPADWMAAPLQGGAELGYLLCNGHCRRVRMKMNLRELYHFSRLRMDAHAQWEIRDLACELASLVQGVAPVSAAYLCGKDAFEETKK